MQSARTAARGWGGATALPTRVRGAEGNERGRTRQSRTRSQTTRCHARTSSGRPGLLQPQSLLRPGRPPLRLNVLDGDGVDSLLGDDGELDSNVFWGYKLFEDEEDMAVPDVEDTQRSKDKVPGRSPDKCKLIPIEEEEQQEDPQTAALRQRCTQQALAASDAADIAAAEEALTAMEAEDLRIGPFIYHAAVCAYVRADDPEGGLSVLRRLHLDGERALVETYDVLIKGFVLQEDLDRAYDVLRAVARSEYDAEASWNNALLTTLYRAGKVHMLMDEVAEGRAAGYGSFGDVSYVERGFVLNSQTYLYFIKALCSQGMWEMAEREALLMPLADVKVESKHFVPILRCAGLSGEHFIPVWDQDRKRGEETAFVAQRMLDMLSSNVVLADVKPDRFALHAVLEAYTHFSRDSNDNARRMQKLYGVALERKMEMNALTSMWMACGVLKGDVFQRRVGQVSYLQMRHQWEKAQADFAAGNLDTPCTSDFQIRRALELGKGPTYLMEKVASALKPIFEALVGDTDGRFISLLICDMLTDNCTLTPDMMEEDCHGRTLVTGWMFNSFSGWRLWHLEIPDTEEDPTRRPDEDFSLQQAFNGRQRAATEQEIREELGLDSPEQIALRQAMRSGDTAESLAAAAEAQAMLIEELRNKSASKMTVAEMRQELDSYNLPSKGLRPDIYRRIKVVRQAVKDEVDPEAALKAEQGWDTGYWVPEEEAPVVEDEEEVMMALLGGGDITDDDDDGPGLNLGKNSKYSWRVKQKQLNIKDLREKNPGMTREEAEAELARQELEKQQWQGRVEQEEDWRVKRKKMDMDRMLAANPGMTYEQAELQVIPSEPAPPPDDAFIDDFTGRAWRADQMSLKRRLELGLEIMEGVVALGGYPTTLDYEALMYHACAAGDMEAVKRLHACQTKKCRPSVRHLHPMRAPQHTTPEMWSAYMEGPWGKKNRETVSSNWAPAQCWENSVWYMRMADLLIKNDEWEAAAYVVEWMQDARWDVPYELRQKLEHYL